MAKKQKKTCANLVQKRNIKPLRTKVCEKVNQWVCLRTGLYFYRNSKTSAKSLRFNGKFNQNVVVQMGFATNLPCLLNGAFSFKVSLFKLSFKNFVKNFKTLILRDYSSPGTTFTLKKKYKNYLWNYLKQLGSFFSPRQKNKNWNSPLKWVSR